MVIVKIHHNPSWNLQHKVEEVLEHLASKEWGIGPGELIILYFQSIHQGSYAEVRFFDGHPSDDWTAKFKADTLIEHLTIEYISS